MKKLLKLLSMISFVLVLAAGGFVGYLFATGRLNGERVTQISKVLRGEWPQQAVATTQRVADEVKPETATLQIARSREQEDLLSLIAERQKRELDDRARLNQTIQFDVMTKLEEIDRREKALAAEREHLAAEQIQSGMARELELLSSIDATRARKLLMMQKEPDVVRLLMDMEPGRGKKILDTCKTTEELEWARRILEQLKNVNDARAAAEATSSAQPRTTGG